MISTAFTFGAVRVLGEVREIQSIKPMPHKHGDDGKSGVWCVLVVPVLGGATGPVGLIGQPIEHNQQDPGPNERP